MRFTIKNTNKGNVLFLILIAVALFAALSYVVTQSSRSGGGNTSKETAKLQAAQLLGYLTNVRQATNRLLISQCTDFDLTFEDPQLSSFYANIGGGPAAQDKCRVFHPLGGGVPYIRPSVELNGGEHIHFVHNMGIDEIGSNYSELVAFVPKLSDEVCKELNIALGIGDVIPQQPTGNLTNPFQKRSVLGTGVAFYTGVYQGKYAQSLNYGSVSFQNLGLPGPYLNSNILYFAIVEK